MSKLDDLTGKVFERLTVLSFVGMTKSRKSRWLCLCDCGNTKTVHGSNLKTGIAKSCGCLHKELASLVGKANVKHAMNNTPTYKSWCALKRRCLGVNSKDYVRYGGRGIKVCEQWLSFENFFKDMGERPVGKTIDRINVNGDYEPSNCKWSTSKEQSQNRRNSKGAK